MPVPLGYFNALFDAEGFKVCRLLNASEFVEFCVKRDVCLTTERLAKWEQLGLLTPVARIYRFDEFHKVEYVDAGNPASGYIDYGILADEEHWPGELRAEPASFGFKRKYADGWREEGYAWSPSETNSKWMDSLSASPQRHTAYYSQFQITSAQFLFQRLTLRVQMEWSVSSDMQSTSSSGFDREAYMQNQVKSLIELNAVENIRDNAALLCQFISNRYYPKTQTDLRKFVLSSHGDWRRWDWHSYSAGWSPAAAIELFNLDEERSRRIYEFLAFEWSHYDPLESWTNLVRFVRLEKRKQLKSGALHGQTLFEMAQTLRWFHKDAFGVELKQPDEVGQQVFYSVPDVPLEEEPLDALEFVSNDFGVNPKSQLVLFVEGQTEEAIVPILFERLFGFGLSVCGIEISNLRGVNNAAGKKIDGFSALWRLIDYLHHHQTIAVVLMDCEGNAERNLRKGLQTANSVYERDRMVTRPDYVKLWNHCFEFDNFYDWEIAESLTRIANAKFTTADIASAKFRTADIRACRESVSKAVRGDKQLKLADLYRSATGHDLDKIALGKELVQFMFSTKANRRPENRPIVKFLEKVCNLATTNHQPNRSDLWKYNQLSGHLGKLKAGAVKRRNALSFSRSKKARPTERN